MNLFTFKCYLSEPDLCFHLMIRYYKGYLENIVKDGIYFVCLFAHGFVLKQKEMEKMIIKYERPRFIINKLN